jgi:pimeloyl-ACP methyl ester carboxylesterase
LKYRSWILAIIAVVGSILLSSCGAQNSSEFLTPEDAQTGDFQLEECTYEIDKVDYLADCGTLIVPENRADPESRLISLPVTRVRSTQSNPAEPIFYMAGGPGGSNMHAQPAPAVLENHDFVMVGYRGVDGSAVLDCPEVGQAMKGDGEDALSGASLAGLASAMRQCAARLQAEGVDLDGYTILEVIDDNEAARQAFGYEQINLISESYGTRVAQYYANLYPDSIHRSAMVSVNPPGHFVWEPDMVDAQLEYYSQLYAQTEEPRTPDLVQTIREISENMPERWLFFKIDPGKVKLISFMLLFNQGTGVQILDAWLSAAEGDPSGFAIMSLAYDVLVPGMFVYGDFFSKGISVDYEPSRDFAAEMDPPGSIIGSPLSKLIWGSAADEEGVTWPTALVPEEFQEVQPSAVETLLVSGNIDFSTPAEYATEELLPALENGEQVILSEMGHTDDVPYLQPEAFEHLLTHFYDTGEVDDSLFVYQPVDFEVGLGFPALAKISLAVIVVLLVLIGLVVRAIIRRRRRKQKA